MLPIDPAYSRQLQGPQVEPWCVQNAIGALKRAFKSEYFYRGGRIRGEETPSDLIHALKVLTDIKILQPTTIGREHILGGCVTRHYQPKSYIEMTLNSIMRGLKELNQGENVKDLLSSDPLCLFLIYRFFTGVAERVLTMSKDDYFEDDYREWLGRCSREISRLSDEFLVVPQMLFSQCQYNGVELMTDNVCRLILNALKIGHVKRLDFFLQKTVPHVRELMGRFTADKRRDILNKLVSIVNEQAEDSGPMTKWMREVTPENNAIIKLLCWLESARDAQRIKYRRLNKEGLKYIYDQLNTLMRSCICGRTFNLDDEHTIDNLLLLVTLYDLFKRHSGGTDNWRRAVLEMLFNSLQPKNGDSSDIIWSEQVNAAYLIITREPYLLARGGHFLSLVTHVLEELIRESIEDANASSWMVEICDKLLTPQREDMTRYRFNDINRFVEGLPIVLRALCCVKGIEAFDAAHEDIFGDGSSVFYDVLSELNVRGCENSMTILLGLLRHAELERMLPYPLLSCLIQRLGMTKSETMSIFMSKTFNWKAIWLALDRALQQHSNDRVSGIIRDWLRTPPGLRTSLDRYIATLCRNA